MGIIAHQGRVTPEQAPGLAGLFYAFAGATGIAASTIADIGEISIMGSNISLKYISGFLGEMSGWGRITAATIGVMTALAIHTPMTYYVQNALRPWLLTPRDFFQLLSRRAFTDPETLRNPELVTTMKQIAPAGGAAFEQSMLGYYGYPAEYYGFFTELANTPLRYFPLQGIARAGWFDEPWFYEALARSGYSETAKERLMDMYRSQAAAAKMGPAVTQLRRLAREQFITLDEYRSRRAQAGEVKDMEEASVLAMEYEREYEIKDLTLDIIMQSYTRGLISEAAAAASLIRLGLPEEIADLHILREKLGLVRKIKIELPPVTQTWEVVEESEF
jgi:hypothetical protein